MISLIQKSMIGALGLALMVAGQSLAGEVTSLESVLGSTQQGDPQIKSINCIEFAPAGVLLVGDGAGGQIVAIATEDVEAVKNVPAKVAGIDAKIASALGQKADGIRITDLAVNPASGLPYFVVQLKTAKRGSDRRFALVKLTNTGKIEEVTFDAVRFAKIGLPKFKDGSVKAISDLAWTGKSVVAAGRTKEEFASKIFRLGVPLKDGSTAQGSTAQTYHVSHGRWETKAPMSALVPFEQDGKEYLVGAFACTPVVRFAVDAIKEGALVKGESVIELGSGNRPTDIISFEQNGKSYVLLTAFRFHHGKRPYGPSELVAFVFPRELLGAQGKLNEGALRRIGKTAPKDAGGIQLVHDLFGVVNVDNVDNNQLWITKKTNSGLDLERVEIAKILKSAGPQKAMSK